MTCYDSSTIPLEALIHMKIVAYRTKHNGKTPARIFMSNRAFLQLTLRERNNVQVISTGDHTMFGIPVSVFDGNGNLPIYLSDEEEDLI